VYDRKGKLLYVQNGTDKMTYHYDKADKLLSITSNKKPGVLPPVGSSFKYNYQGFVSSEIFYMKRILYSYDSSGRLLKSLHQDKQIEPFCSCTVWKKTSAITYTYPP
jgi:YD repeat-containing protein